MYNCHSDPTFNVEGVIKDADGKTLYLEVRNIYKNEIIDSCKLDDKGQYRFQEISPEYPEFYALKLDNQYIFFSIDSTETVTINSQAKDFSTDYQVDGSLNAQRIKELGLLQHVSQLKVNEILKQQLPADSAIKLIEPILAEYKEEAIKYILSGDYAGTQSPVAYFAIFQRINDYLIFDVYNDVKLFGAVATGYEQAYPESPRTKHLRSLVLQTRNAIRQENRAKELEVNYANNIEIELPDIMSETIKLSSTLGKVVVLDFTIYQSPFSPARNLDLREMYNKYHDRGFEIYQVSLDTDENFWKVSASNLPWLCVRDASGIYSSAALLYNVEELPTYYLLSREGELIKKGNDINEELEHEILRLL
ncbi:MAG: AhpC/TSA family protein [Candidatus Azobacteroides sp.]|nr:AhpC/TSA family protein [Candidatus Azobacteroides sp.]